MKNDPKNLVEKLPAYELKLLEEYNIARSAQGLTLCKVKIRTCSMCSKRFESFSYRSCSKCTRKIQEMMEKTDHSFMSEF